MQDAPGNNFKGNWSSVHVGGPNFLFFDGSVRRILYDTPWPVMAALLTYNQGETVPDF